MKAVPPAIHIGVQNVFKKSTSSTIFKQGRCDIHRTFKVNDVEYELDICTHGPPGRRLFYIYICAWHAQKGWMYKEATLEETKKKKYFALREMINELYHIMC